MKAPVRRRFARVYFDDLERDHPTTFYDPTALSTWLRLLILSEKAWPALPQLPRATRRADLETLRKDRLLIDVDHGAFELQGWRKDRAKRAEVGLGAVGARRDRKTKTPTEILTNVEIVVPNNDVPAHAPTSLSTSISSTERGPGETEERDSLDTYYDLTRFRPWGVWSGKALRGLEADYGVAKVVAAIEAEHAKGTDREELLKAVEARLAKDADRMRQERPPRRVIAKPDRAAVNAELRKLMGLGEPA